MLGQFELLLEPAVLGFEVLVLNIQHCKPFLRLLVFGYELRPSHICLFDIDLHKPYACMAQS
jgi:hypothetical protein